MIKLSVNSNVVVNILNSHTNSVWIFNVPPSLWDSKKLLLVTQDPDDKNCRQVQKVYVFCQCSLMSAKDCKYTSLCGVVNVPDN